MLRGFVKAVLALPVIFQSTMDLSDCSIANSVAKITSFSYEPQAPVPGDNTVLTVNYDLYKNVTGGTALYSVTLNGIPYPNTKDDLCTQTECPKYAGPQTEISKSVFPEISGKLISKIQWFDENDDPIWCLQMIYRS